MAEAWRSKPFPQTVACQICTLELTIPSPEVIPFLSCEACGATPCARLCGRWFASEQGAAKHTLSCGRMAARKPKPPSSPPRQASTLPVHGLLEGAAPPAPSPVVTPPPSNVVAAPTARDAAAARAEALEARLRSAREQHEKLVRLHEDAMRRVVASGAAASAAEAREELAEIREEVVALRAAAAADAELRAGALAEAREEAAREAVRADAASAAAERARKALVAAEATAHERERAHEEALARCRDELRRAKAKA